MTGTPYAIHLRSDEWLYLHACGRTVLDGHRTTSGLAWVTCQNCKRSREWTRRVIASRKRLRAERAA